jgi:16S rRNA G966 N2-methylase RsmD
MPIHSSKRARNPISFWVELLYEVDGALLACGKAMGNSLYYGDNLAVLRESIKEESVDLIYLDPPLQFERFLQRAV